MRLFDLPAASYKILLQDACQRDRVTARRVYLMRILWQERYLTRLQLVVRVESWLGKDCFGHKAVHDTFYRDLKVVKQAFQESGYELKYSRSTLRPGYFLKDQPAVSETLKRAIQGSSAEVNRQQIAILRQFSAAKRFALGASISDTARQAVAYRIRQRHPELSIVEANRLALSTNSA